MEALFCSCNPWRLAKVATNATYIFNGFPNGDKEVMR